MNELNNIIFIEDTGGYRERTIKNASADATLAIAMDFTSAGERLTKRSVLDQNKYYQAIDICRGLNIEKEVIDHIVDQFNVLKVKTINIAGNGIYTMRGYYTQEQCDKFTYDLLNTIISSEDLMYKIDLIRTGGQTGFDESGAKAGEKLGIKTIVLSPHGWKFRDLRGDISNEVLFKKRFDLI